MARLLFSDWRVPLRAKLRNGTLRLLWRTERHADRLAARLRAWLLPAEERRRREAFNREQEAAVARFRAERRGAGRRPTPGP